LNIYITQGSVATHLRCGGIFLQILYKICQWKNFESRLLFGEDMDSNQVGRFLRHSVVHP